MAGLSKTQQINRKGQARPTVATAAPTGSSSVPCPFTGMAIEIRTVGPDAQFMGIGPFYSTKLYPTRAALMAAICARPGVRSAPAPAVKVAAPEKLDPMDNVFEGLGDPSQIEE